MILALTIYGISQIYKPAGIDASPFDSDPDEVALAFALNINQGDYEGALSYYDSLADASQPSKNLEDLINATGIKAGCALATDKVSETTADKLGSVFIVDIPYVCEGKRVYQKFYVSNGNWDTPNGKGKFVLPESAGKAGNPLR